MENIFDNLMEFRKTTSLKQQMWVTEREATIIKDCIKSRRIERYIECGTAHGFSASIAVYSLLAGGVQYPEVFTWDLANRTKVYDIKEFNLLSKYINFFHETFENMPNRVKEKDKKTFYFIDGDHRTAFVNKDWAAVRSHMKSGDVVGFHDVKEYRGISRLVGRLIESSEYDGNVIDTERGVGLIWKI